MIARSRDFEPRTGVQCQLLQLLLGVVLELSMVVLVMLASRGSRQNRGGSEKLNPWPWPRASPKLSQKFFILCSIAMAGLRLFIQCQASRHPVGWH